MRMLLRSMGWVMALAFWCGQASAAMTPDPTGMWYDPNQPGWGVSLTQQGDNIFAVLFTYDANHNPEWFVASNVVDTGTFVNFLVGEAYAGPLYRTSAATYLQPNDTTALSATPVGTIQIAYTMPNNNLSVAYSVNGTTVNKVLTPQTWGSNAGLLVGNFAGALNISSNATCAAPVPLQNVTRFSIARGAATDSLVVTWGTGTDTGCTMTGTYAQRGQLASLTGTVMCGPIPNPMTSAGTLDIEQMTIGPSGFSGYLTYQSPIVNSSSCGVGGSIGGVKN